MSSLADKNKKIEETVVSGYTKIEDTVVGGYTKIQDTVVGGYEKMEDFFVEKLFQRGNETTEEAKERLRANHPAPEQTQPVQDYTHPVQVYAHPVPENPYVTHGYTHQVAPGKKDSDIEK